eukprot:11218622-Lingulodinium_polyedra.AAC.1
MARPGGGRNVFWQATPPLLVLPPPVDALLETELRRHNRGAIAGPPLPSVQAEPWHELRFEAIMESHNH